MQISSNHSAFNFGSVYRSVVTRHSQPAIEPAPAPSASIEHESGDEDDRSGRLHRESLMLQAAHRVAERTADLLAASPDL